MAPIIHYCWFGGEKPPWVVNRLALWRKKLPSWRVQEWNETNLNIIAHPYLERAIKFRQWAFAADYARLLVLEKCGGVYFDTDIEVVGDLMGLPNARLILGFEKNYVHAGVIASEAHHPFIRRLLEIYDNNVDVGILDKMPKSIVNRVTDLLIDEWNLKTVFGETCLADGIRILPADYLLLDLKKGNSITVHHYDASWKIAFDKASFTNEVKYYCDWQHAPLVFRIKEHLKMILQFQLPGVYRFIRDYKRT